MQRPGLSRLSLFLPLFSAEHVCHRVDHRGRWKCVIQAFLNRFEIACALKHSNRVELPEAVRGRVHLEPEQLRSALHVMPYRLPRPVLRGIASRKSPNLARARFDLSKQLFRQTDLPALPRFRLCNPKARRKLFRFQR